MYKIQKTLPNKGNKFYNNGNNNGYSWCINGKPTVDGLNVLCNCVGWSCARFNEIYSSETGYQGMKYPQLNCNAENFYGRAKDIGLEVRQEPTNGGIMIWEGKGSLAGHVANVEKINSDGSIFTSESGYNDFDFRNYTRSNSNGNWSLDTRYFKYLGCIVNPCNPQPEDEPQPTPPTPGDYPFEGIIKQGAKLYDVNGYKYPCDCKANRDCTVQGEGTDKVSGKYKVYCSAFDPKIVYTDKSNVTKKGTGYPFPAIVKKGSQLYDVNGYKYNTAQADRPVTVQGEVNGRYQIWGKTFKPNVVYCDKSAIMR